MPWASGVQPKAPHTFSFFLTYRECKNKRESAEPYDTPTDLPPSFDNEQFMANLAASQPPTSSFFCHKSQISHRFIHVYFPQRTCKEKASITTIPLFYLKHSYPLLCPGLGAAPAWGGGGLPLLTATAPGSSRCPHSLGAADSGGLPWAGVECRPPSGCLGGQTGARHAVILLF